MDEPCYSNSNWEEGNFDVGWSNFSNGSEANSWKYQKNENGYKSTTSLISLQSPMLFDRLGFYGLHKRYPSGGYIHSLGNSSRAARQVLTHLKDTTWIDRQ